jgi:hypothetical protein
LKLGSARAALPAVLACGSPLNPFFISCFASFGLTHYQIKITITHTTGFRDC